MRRVVLYGSPACHLCAAAKAKLERVRRLVAFDFREIDIRGDPQLLARYATRIPVVEVDGRDALVSKVTEFRLLRALLSGQRP
jgi:glutaredoxin-related protein